MTHCGTAAELFRQAAHGPEDFTQHPSQAMDLVDKIENDADAFVINRSSGRALAQERHTEDGSVTEFLVVL